MAIPVPGSDPDEARAIAEHFEGDVALYLEFRASCLAQFPLDAATGDAACHAGDAQALRRLAHALRTVLLTLGRAEASALAGELEHQAEAGAGDLVALWQRLRGELLSLSERQI